MAEYIERGEAIKAVISAEWEHGSDGAMAMEIVAGAPVADVRPERYGEWVQQLLRSCFACSECNYCFEHEGYLAFFNYYPNCGAKMDGKDIDK